MKIFKCRCGQPVYFDSHECLECGAKLGFDVARLDMLSLDEDDNGVLIDSDGNKYRRCTNGEEYGVCNWLTKWDSGASLCAGCAFNRTVPGLEKAENVVRWGRFESSKKRLLYTLLQLELPVRNGFEDPENGLLLDFIEDSRSDSDRFPESFVHTGYLGGVITINALEADDSAREAMKAELGESYRTMLGHLRHESGHYFWSILNPGESELARFSQLFGDIDTNYSDALENYYSNGPRRNWSERHISAYASSHPVEDWAECWGHYLHIVDALETAASHGVSDFLAGKDDIRAAIESWQRFSIVLNELNRSSGVADAYPFVVNAAVAEKLVFVDEVVSLLRKRH